MATVISKRVVTLELIVGYSLLAVGSITTWFLLALSASYLLQVSILYSIFGLILIKVWPDECQESGIGWANRITVLRAILSIIICATIFHVGSLEAGGYWWVVILSVIALSLDGLDGWLARYTQTESSFGAKLDMEVDAFLLLALSVLVFVSGKVTFWIVFIGLMRYCFVACGEVWPFLKNQLPMSWRRKGVCAIQGIGLVICLVPVSSRSFAYNIAMLSLGSLMYSFCADTRWLYMNRMSA